MSESFCSQSNETVGFNVLAAEIGVFLPGVAEPIVNAAIFRTSVEFLSKSRVHRSTISLQFQQYTNEYPAETINCNTVLSVEEVRFDGHILEDFTITSDGWVKLPDRVLDKCSNTSFEVDVVLGLSKDACELPKFVYERFGHGIINMSLGRLYGMFGEQWYDLNAVRLYGGIGNQSISDAMTAVLIEDSPKGVPVVGIGLIL